jgi:hypothetical protein
MEGERVTKLPAETWAVTGVTGPDYQVGPRCSVPNCGRFTDHAHHIWRRSFLGGDYNYVVLNDGEAEYENLTGLCYKHHQMVTENTASIVMNDKGVFYWAMGNSVTSPITPQPRNVSENPDKNLDENQGEEAKTSGGHKEVCSGCGRPMPKPKIETPKEETKHRKTWAVSVPADERENGYAVLEELLSAATEKLDEAGLHYDKGNKVKYYPLATALGLFVQFADDILSDE